MIIREYKPEDREGFDIGYGGHILLLYTFPLGNGQTAKQVGVANIFKPDGVYWGSLIFCAQ